jgi:hypothetical protein
MGAQASSDIDPTQVPQFDWTNSFTAFTCWRHDGDSSMGLQSSRQVSQAAPVLADDGVLKLSRMNRRIPLASDERSTLVGRLSPRRGRAMDNPENVGSNVRQSKSPDQRHPSPSRGRASSPTRNKGSSADKKLHSNSPTRLSVSHHNDLSLERSVSPERPSRHRHHRHHHKHGSADTEIRRKVTPRSPPS